MKCDMAGSLVTEPLDKSPEGILWPHGHHDALWCSLSGTGHGERQPEQFVPYRYTELMAEYVASTTMAEIAVLLHFRKPLFTTHQLCAPYASFGVNTVWGR